MSVSESGSDVTIPIQDSPPPPPSPYNNPRNENDDPSKTPEPCGDVIVTTGVDNEGYQPESKDEKSPKEKRHHTQITMNGPGDGDSQPPLNEGLNAELINLNILNTIPDKPQAEFGPYDNFDEYFIPVNQHKKFLRRSEKLYVTKDKRKQSQWKKYICWIIGAFILLSIVTVAVLAGVGLIPQKSSNTFVKDSVVATTSSGNNLDFASTTTEKRLEPTLTTSTEYSTTTTTSAPILPPDDTYVPNSADVEFHITDLQYEAALNDKTTDRFRELASEIEQEMKSVLRKNAGLENAFVRVSQFQPGSVHTKMRIGWVEEQKNLNEIQMALSKMTSFGSHTIEAVSSFGVVNHCKFNNNNGCSHFCTFDYESLEFLCTCPETMLLDIDKKICSNITVPTSSEQAEGESASEDSSDTESATIPESTDAPLSPEAVSVSQSVEDIVPVPVTPETIEQPTSSSAAPAVATENPVSSSAAPELESVSVAGSDGQEHVHDETSESPVEEHSIVPSEAPAEQHTSSSPTPAQTSISHEHLHHSSRSDTENEAVILPVPTTTEKSSETEEENSNPTNPPNISENTEEVHVDEKSQSQSSPEEILVATTTSPVEENSKVSSSEAEIEPESTITPMEILEIITAQASTTTSTTTTTTTEAPVVVTEEENEQKSPSNENLNHEAQEETSEREATHEEESAAVVPVVVTTTTTAAPASQEDERSESLVDKIHSDEGETTVHPEQSASETEVEGQTVISGRSKTARHETFGEESTAEHPETPEAEEVVAQTEQSVSPSSAVPSTSSEFMVFSDNGSANQGSTGDSEGTTDSTQNDSNENASGSGSVETTGSASVESKTKEDLISASAEKDEATTIPPPSLVHDTAVNDLGNVTEDSVNSEPLVSSPVSSPPPPLAPLIEATTINSESEAEEENIEKETNAPIPDVVEVTSTTTTTTTTPTPAVVAEVQPSGEPIEQSQQEASIPPSDPLFAVTTASPSTAADSSSQPLSATIKIITPQTKSNEYETGSVESVSDENVSQPEEPSGIENDL